MVRVTDWPAWRIRNSSSWNSRGCRFYILTLAVDGAGDQVHLQIADLEHGLNSARLAATRQGLDPRDQFGQGVGLDQIVVAARLQPRNAILDLAESRQEQHRRLVAALADGLDHADAVQARHHSVHDIDVVAALLRFQQAKGAVHRMGDFMPGLAQAAHHGGRGLGVVLNHQNTHAASQKRFGGDVSASPPIP